MLCLIKRLKRARRLHWWFRGLPNLNRANALYQIAHNTMTSTARCNSLWDLCSMVNQKGVEGNFVECGVWKGGSAGIMGLVMMKSAINRQLHLFDSFEGLPEPTDMDGLQAAEYSGGKSSGRLESVNQCKAGIEIVENLLHTRLNIPKEKTVYHAGWFQNTVPEQARECGKIAVLRLDGDWYESTKICLENLYDQLSVGGVLILDDYYAWEGCKKATDEFRSQHSIADPIVRIDSESVYWIKN